MLKEYENDPYDPGFAEWQKGDLFSNNRLSMLRRRRPIGGSHRFPLYGTIRRSGIDRLSGCKTTRKKPSVDRDCPRTRNHRRRGCIAIQAETRTHLTIE